MTTFWAFSHSAALVHVAKTGNKAYLKIVANRVKVWVGGKLGQ